MRLFLLLFGFCCFEPFLASLVVDRALGLGVHVGGAHCCCLKKRKEKNETDDDDDIDA